MTIENSIEKDDNQNNDEEVVIRFTAAVAKVQTLVDGGLRVTLDLSEKEIKAASDLMKCKQRGAVIEIAAIPVVPQKYTDIDDETKKSAKGNSTSVDSRRIDVRRNKRKG